MALFISQENQKLLYEMIHRTPTMNMAFPQGSPVDEKNAWFRGVIEHFYQNITGDITREQLKIINRNVLGYMVNQLQERNTQMIQRPTVPVFNTLKREHAPEYESSKSQYNSLFDTPKPKPIDFSEKLEDDAITNMEELIENHKKMREQELRQYAPPMPISSPVKIMQDVSKEELYPTVINEKKVHFTSPQSLEIDVSKEIENIHIKIDSMESKLNEMIEFMKQCLPKESPVDIIKSNMNSI